MNVYLVYILQKMCDIVGADYWTIDFSWKGGWFPTGRSSSFIYCEPWYKEYSWTPREEKCFRLWLKMRMLQMPEMQIELWGYDTESDHVLDGRIAMFNLGHGWVTKRPPEDDIYYHNVA